MGRPSTVAEPLIIAEVQANDIDIDYQVNGGAVTTLVISSVKKDDNTVEGSASALTGNETVIKAMQSMEEVTYQMLLNSLNTGTMKTDDKFVAKLNSIVESVEKTSELSWEFWVFVKAYNRLAQDRGLTQIKVG